jgi:hypothetical protein
MGYHLREVVPDKFRGLGEAIDSSGKVEQRKRRMKLREQAK